MCTRTARRLCCTDNMVEDAGAVLLADFIRSSTSLRVLDLKREHTAGALVVIAASLALRQNTPA